GLDIGGTFTDVVAIDEKGGIQVAKSSTTPDDYTRGVMNALRELELDLKNTGFFCHGTTVGTNALLEGKFARTAVITTKGFRDIMELRRGERVWPDVPNYLFNLQLDLAQRYWGNTLKPLTLRRDRFEVPERVDCTGKVVRSLDEAELRKVIGRIKDAGLKSVAISFLFSYMYPQHERRAKELVQEYLPDAYVSASTEVLPIFREYERTSTTVINCAIGPVLSRYFTGLERELHADGFPRNLDLLIMGSNGGVMTAASASERAAHAVLSGPAGGVIGAQALGKLTGHPNILAMSMGGTSFDVSLIEQGEPTVTTETHVGKHYRLATPMLGINTIGAGGGSIAWVDPGGAIRVGPQSAGASPGPACYHQGGTEPTVTDANMVLGYLNPDYFLGGKMRIDPDLSHRAVERLARDLGMSVTEAALAVHQIVNANMAAAMRVVSVEKGFDPRDFVAVAYGAAGPTHACRLASLMSIPRVLVPETPGAFCCWGFLVSDVMHEYHRSHVTPTQGADIQRISTLYREMEAEGLDRVLRDGVPRKDILFQRTMDLRYIGQAHEVTVPVSNGRFLRSSLEEAIRNFHKLHEKYFAIQAPDEPTELTTLGVKAIGLIEKTKPKAHRAGSRDARKAVKYHRKVYFAEAGRYVHTPVYDRYALNAGNGFTGPAIVEQVDTTVIVPPSHRVAVDRFRNLVIQTR
ncbi:MAG: hydantoinase/oxoprolinase family protein, partial [Euryarchaeota archaeon]|nr:hydantoinase/oxoprolinase family protein [Euryarchaeota archaeon]